MSERLVIEERTALAASVAPGRSMVLTLNVALAPASGASKPVTLLTPFRCELGVTRRVPAPKPESPAMRTRSTVLAHGSAGWKPSADSTA